MKQCYSFNTFYFSNFTLQILIEITGEKSPGGNQRGSSFASILKASVHDSEGEDWPSSVETKKIIDLTLHIDPSTWVPRMELT